MKEKLQQLLEKSYSPYSHFPVAAIAVMKDGKEIPGVNVEVASYGGTICAERVAITSAISQGYQKKEIEKLYIMTKNHTISTCCFLCRQFLVEFMDADRFVICMNLDGDEQKYQVKELCPHPFCEGDLK